MPSDFAHAAISAISEAEDTPSLSRVKVPGIKPKDSSPAPMNPSGPISRILAAIHLKPVYTS